MSPELGVVTFGPGARYSKPRVTDGIIVDADVIIGGEKGTFDLRKWVKSRANDHFEIAAITVAELWQGVERTAGTHKVTRERFLRTMLELLPVIPYTELTAYEHARIWAFLESSGKMIGFYDLIVAATALERGSTVATFNRRHFGQVPGLTVIEPR
ncbi:MAG: PIN domain-containing protein [Acidobacteria bacterium]|nr:PIN domain-containing protein [Acidobacteriota bacterium]